MSGKRKVRNLKYSKALILCHGKSELQIAKHITTNLRLPIKTDAEKNGTISIQITSLMQFLSNRNYSTPENFAEHFGAELIGSGKKAHLDPNFRVYIMMDTDDCTEQQKKDFINGSMFAKHWLSPYIVPVYCNSNLEDVMCKAGIMTKRIKDSQKGSYYERVFPIEPL